MQCSTESLKDPQVAFKWSNVGVLDYDPNTDAWLVQRVDDNGRVLDNKGNTVVNGGARDKSILFKRILFNFIYNDYDFLTCFKY